MILLLNSMLLYSEKYELILVLQDKDQKSVAQ